MPADVLPVAIRGTPLFPGKSAGQVSRPARPEPQNIPRQTINNWLWSLSRLKKLAGFSPSRPPARYSAGYKTRRSPSAHNSKHLPADLITVVNPATPRFSQGIRRSNFLVRASRAPKHSVTTNKQSAVVSVAAPKTLQFRAEPVTPTPKPISRGRQSLVLAAECMPFRAGQCAKIEASAGKEADHNGVRKDQHRPRIQSLTSCPEHASQQAPSERTSVFRRKPAAFFFEDTIAISGAAHET
jgi:hypothetical protein